jgi:hypothetical protein
MNYTDLVRSMAVNGAVRCSIGSALVTSSLYTIADHLSGSEIEKKKKSWAQMAVGTGEGVAGIALIANGAKQFSRF